MQLLPGLENELKVEFYLHTVMLQVTLSFISPNLEDYRILKQKAQDILIPYLLYCHTTQVFRDETCIYGLSIWHEYQKGIFFHLYSIRRNYNPAFHLPTNTQTVTSNHLKMNRDYYHHEYMPKKKNLRIYGVKLYKIRPCWHLFLHKNIISVIWQAQAMTSVNYMVNIILFAQITSFSCLFGQATRLHIQNLNLQKLLKNEQRYPSDRFLSYFIHICSPRIIILLNMTELLVSKQTGNQYKIIAKIGEGAYADVFKGQNINTKQTVAIKKMKHMKKADADMAKKQIELMKSLNHKNIVKFIDQFRHNGVWYIILQYCGKGDLDKYKQKVGRIPEYHCKVLVRGILEALVELHSVNKEKNKKKIAHRDLKLPNILINDQYQLKLADFGFSKDFEDGWMKSFCGTPLTMAPEVLKRDAYNEKCDVWSLGVITYYLLYNKYPYFPTKSDGPGLQGITNCVVNKPLVFDKNVQVSDIGKDFIIQCLQRQLDKRPYSHQLLNHVWFNLQEKMRHTQVRADIIGSSFEERPQKDALNCCKVMLFGVIQELTKKIYETLLINEKRIRDNISLFKTHYKNQDQILQYYLLIAQKKLEELTKKSFIIILQNRSIKVEAGKINKFIQHYKSSLSFILSELQQLKPNRPDNVNIEKQLIKFLLTESELLMESYNEQEISQKLKFLKDIAKIMIKQYESSIVDVKWGGREDLNRYAGPIVDFILNVKDEEILSIINEEHSNDDDLQSIWLIEYQTNESSKEKKNGSIETELGKQILYILNIPSNFTVEKSSQSDKFELDFQNIEIC